MKRLLIPFCAALLSGCAAAPDASPLSPAATKKEAPLAPPPDGIIVFEQGLIISGPSTRHRGGLVSYYGGSIKPQKNLETAMAWLAKSQNADGSWGTKNPGRLTAQISLVFRAKGHSRNSVFYGKNVTAALAFLVASSLEDRDTQALRLCALAENQIVSPDESLGAPLQAGLRKLIDGKAEADSVATLAVTCRAFQDAYQAGCREDGLIEAYQATLDRLKVLTMAGPADAESRAAAFYALAAAGRAWDRNGKILPELEPLAHQVFQEDNKALDWSQPQPISTWHQHTYAAFEQGGDEWRNWRQTFEPILRKNQQAEGYWTPPGLIISDLDQRLETTAHACLMLEVYYAYKRSQFFAKEAEAQARKSAAGVKP